MAKQIADGWHEVTESIDVYTEDGFIIRATKNGGQLPASVYKWDKTASGWVNACPIKYSTFRSGWQSGKYTIS